MKKIILTLSILTFGFLSSVDLQATVHIVDNNTYSPTGLTTVTDAVTIALPGDTIYIQPSPNAYAGFDVTKPNLTFIGIGRNSSNQNAGISNISGAIFIEDGADDTEINGLYLSSSSQGRITANNTGEQADNVKILNNYLGYFSGSTTIGLSGNNWEIRNNVIRRGIAKFGAGQGQNILISNNIIGNGITGFNDPSVIVKNNVFTKYISSVGTGSDVFGCSNIIVEENIFLVDPSGCSQCIFNNNGVLDDDNIVDLPYGDNTGNNNVNDISVFTLFVGSSAGDLLNEPIDYLNYDFTLQAASGLTTAGTDGGPIGLFDGLQPFTQNGEPNIPQILEATFENNIIPEGGTLHLNAKSVPNGN